MTDLDKPSVVVTGISGALGLSLLPELTAYKVTGIDLEPPATSEPLRFARLDLSLEESCRQLFYLLREIRPVAVIHLAFMTNPPFSKSGDADRMWQTNVGGTARVMEAVTEANRDEEIVKKFIFLSCAAVYGLGGGAPATEESRLESQSLAFAAHKMEADRAVQQRAPSARDCSVYVLRGAPFVGNQSRNHLLGVLLGSPDGRSKRSEKMRSRGTRLPCIFPWGSRYLQHEVQFVNVEDVARLIVYILRKSDPEARRLTILNVSGRGDSLPLERCIELAGSRVLRVPGQWTMRQILKFLWRSGMYAAPPEAAPYLFDGQIMNTSRLQEFLGPYYQDVIRHTVADAFMQCFRSESASRAS